MISYTIYTTLPTNCPTPPHSSSSYIDHILCQIKTLMAFLLPRYLVLYWIWAWHNGSQYRKVVRTKSILPSVSQWLENTQSTLKWVSKACPLCTQRGLEICHDHKMETPDVSIDTNLNKTVRAKGIRNVHMIFGCSFPENVMKMKIHQRSSMWR